MNIQEQEKKLTINIKWEIAAQILLFLLRLLGKDDLLKKIHDLFDEEEVTTQGDPTCIPPKVWNPILKKCVDDL